MAGYSAFGRWLEENGATRPEHLGSGVSGWRQPRIRIALDARESQPRPDNIRALSRALGVPIEDVYAALGRIPQNVEPESLRTLMELATRLSPEDQELAAALLRQLVRRENHAQNRALVAVRWDRPEGRPYIGERIVVLGRHTCLTPLSSSYALSLPLAPAPRADHYRRSPSIERLCYCTTIHRIEPCLAPCAGWAGLRLVALAASIAPDGEGTPNLRISTERQQRAERVWSAVGETIGYPMIRGIAR